MKATLTQLRRETSRVVRPVIAGKSTVELTEHGIVVARLSPIRKPDPKKALAALDEIRKLGGIKIPPRS
jgi:antitoxin (DNA-binding transcriptional repressor) of toxin-antitoxin stability system